jgi:ABC-type polysaccharide/polyol phosphate export permease
MMGVLTFIFTEVLPNRSIHAFPVFVLCGLVPFNFFSHSWAAGTNSVAENAGLVKRVPIPRIVIPIASVLSNCVQLLVQIGILLAFTLMFGFGPNRYWALLPLLWFLGILLVTGLVLACSAIDVYVRDTRYVVESINVVLFWLVPIFYSFNIIPARFHFIYQYNPLAILVLALRNILLDGSAPPLLLMWKLLVSSVLVFAGGWFIFQSLQRRFYEYL